MGTDKKTDPAREVEAGASRKHDELRLTHEEDRASRDRYFNDDGNKVTDVPFVGERTPDTDPDDRPPEGEHEAVS